MVKEGNFYKLIGSQNALQDRDHKLLGDGIIISNGLNENKLLVQPDGAFDSESNGRDFAV